MQAVTLLFLQQLQTLIILSLLNCKVNRYSGIGKVQNCNTVKHDSWYSMCYMNHFCAMHTISYI